MRYIIRKFVDAETVSEAIGKEASTPIHDVYLKEGEEPKRDNSPKDCIGYQHPEEPGFGEEPEPYGKKR